ncbi:MAG TPA: hypothetical protein VGR79_02960 [Stellaceae bacterium]|nr:hypothetical protein [Stellaceae bacterium]
MGDRHRKDTQPPSCADKERGFVSSHHGNKLAIDLERRKLALVAEVATEVWGGI